MQSVPPPMLLPPFRRQRGEVESSNSIVDRHQSGDGVNNGSDPEDDGAVKQMYVRTIAPDVRLDNQENQSAYQIGITFPSEQASRLSSCACADSFSFQIAGSTNNETASSLAVRMPRQRMVNRSSVCTQRSSVCFYKDAACRSADSRRCAEKFVSCGLHHPEGKLPRHGPLRTRRTRLR
jgi:hypothetical protein